MSDSKGPIGGTFEDVNEAVVKPVVDEVGKMVELGVQSVKGQQQTQPQNGINPQQIQQKQSEDQQKLYRWRWWLNNRQKQMAEDRRRVEEANRQKQAQNTQEEQKKQEVKQFEIVKKQDKNIALQRAKTKTEIRGGVGG